MRNRFLLTTLGVLVLVGCSGGGSNPPPDTPDYFDELGLSLRWSSSKTANPLRVFIGTDAGTSRSAIVMAAANEWAAATSNVVRFTQVSTEGEADIVVTFKPTISGGDGEFGLGGVAFDLRPDNPTADGIITRGTVDIKSGLTDKLLQSIAAHEFGHVLGIVARTAGGQSHSSYSGDVMHANVPAGLSVSTRDGATLVKLYSLSRAHQ
jgi:predicted Zn-dependent protease